MTILRVLGFVLSLVVTSLPTQAQQTFVETFDGGSNEGGWTYGPPGSIQPGGGNPGAYWYEPLVDTFAPQPRTSISGSPFTGNYRAQSVSSVGIDLITLDVDFSAGGRPLTVLLNSDNGTPADFSDDWAAYFLGPDNIPLVGQGWLSYDFAVPSQDTSFPPGWDFILFGPNSPANPDWNAVITNVSKLGFFYGDPQLFFIFQQWELGLDNPRITTDLIVSSDPGRVPPTVQAERVSATEIRLSWSASVCTGARDYAIYEGSISGWYDHTPIDCHDDGLDLTEVVPASAGNRYYLVVPFNLAGEGSYGLDWDGPSSTALERPTAGVEACRETQVLSCP